MRAVLAGLTIRGRCLLAAGFAAALCSIVLNERDLLRIAVFLVGLPLLAAALASRGRVGLSADRELLPSRLPVGAVTEVRLHVRSTGKLPMAGLLLEDGTPYALGDRPRFVVDGLNRRGAAAVSYPLQPMLRGVHRLGPLVAKVTDPFGLAEFDRELGANGRLVVVPQVVELAALPGSAGLGSGDDGAIRLRTGQGEDDAVVRPYRHGDDLRKVHWRSTARQDELMVRVEERPWRGGTTVLLDRRSAAHRGSGAGSSLEWAVSFTASVCLHLHRYGHQVRLSVEDGQVLSGGAGDGGHSDSVVLDALAALQPSHGRDLVLGRDPAIGREVIAVLGAATAASAAELARFRPRGTTNLAVLLDVARWSGTGEESAPDPEEAARVLRATGWHVTIARPDSPMRQVWQELCGEGLLRDPDLLRKAGGG